MSPDAVGHAEDETFLSEDIGAVTHFAAYAFGIMAAKEDRCADSRPSGRPTADSLVPGLEGTLTQVWFAALYAVKPDSRDLIEYGLHPGDHPVVDQQPE